MRFSAKYWPTIEIEQKIQEWQNHLTFAQLERENYKYSNIYYYFLKKFAIFTTGLGQNFDKQNPTNKILTKID